ncbi:MAG: DUF971 domain-containing protein [Rhodospirillales bacterium]|nr:DUF971 domain-containing protein [Rhodospirillales bacterium]
MTPAYEPRIDRVETAEDGGVLAVQWSDGSRSRYHALWLRDNALDAATRDPVGGQRLITVLDLDPDIRIAGASVTPAGAEVAFQPGGHRTTFAPAWLYTHRYDAHNRQGWGAPAPWVQVWSSGLADMLPAIDYGTARADKRALADWLAAVRRYGFATMRGVRAEPGAIAEVVTLFGFVRETNYGRIFDVRSQVNAANLAYTSLPLPVHTDNPYRNPVPTLQLLHCLATDAEGGDSILVDGFHAAQVLRAEAATDFELLTRYSAPFAYRGAGDVHLETASPVIRLSPEGELAGIRFNSRSAGPLMVPFDVMRAYYGAYRRFAAVLERAVLRVRFRMAPGDLFIVDNERVLHGRTGFDGFGSRHLQGCYADRDGLYSTLAVIEAELGRAAA